MEIAVVTPVRLIGEGVVAALRVSKGDYAATIFTDIAALRQALTAQPGFAAAIVDASRPLSLDTVRDFHVDFPQIVLLALGVRESERDIVAHGRAGFAGYIGREDGIERLHSRIEDTMAGRLCCPPEISAGIMLGLFERRSGWGDGTTADPLTPRESHVADLVSRGQSNKEIARELSLSESTVKHHVHAVLGKLHLSSRFQLLRGARDDIWGERSYRRAG